MSSVSFYGLCPPAADPTRSYRPLPRRGKEGSARPLVAARKVYLGDYELLAGFFEAVLTRRLEGGA